MNYKDILKKGKSVSRISVSVYQLNSLKNKVYLHFIQLYIQHYLQGLAATYQSALPYLLSEIPQLLMFKSYRRTQIWFSIEKKKSFAAIVKINNRSIQGQDKYGGWYKTDQSASQFFFFLLLFLLY